MAARPNRSLEHSLRLLTKYRVAEYTGELPGVGNVTLRLDLTAAPERKRATVTALPSNRTVDPADIERPALQPKDELERALEFDSAVPEPIAG